MEGAAYWFAGDALGSVAGLVDAGGSVVQRNFYAPFGETIDAAGAFAPPNNVVDQPFASSGYVHDVASALSYFGARYLHSATAAWLTPDPYRGDVTNPASLMRYQFVGNNPVTLYEVDGYSGAQPALMNSGYGRQRDQSSTRNPSKAV